MESSVDSSLSNKSRNGSLCKSTSTGLPKVANSVLPSALPVVSTASSMASQPPLPPSAHLLQPPLPLGPPPGPPPATDNNVPRLTCKSFQQLLAPSNHRPNLLLRNFDAPPSGVLSPLQSNFDSHQASHVPEHHLELIHHSAVYQSFSAGIYPNSDQSHLSVPPIPPLFTMPPSSFNVPPPTLSQPPPAFKAHPECGIPFPPPGYRSTIRSEEKSVPNGESGITRIARRSRSPSAGSSRKSRPVHSKNDSRSRSSSLQRTSSRSQRRDREPHRRRSRSLKRRSRSPKRRSRSPRRSSRSPRRRSRSPRRRSRSPRRRSRSPRRRSRSPRQRSRSLVRRSGSSKRRSRSRSRRSQSRSRRSRSESRPRSRRSRSHRSRSCHRQSPSRSRSHKQSRRSGSPTKRGTRSRSRSLQSCNRKQETRSGSHTRRRSTSSSRAGSRRQTSSTVAKTSQQIVRRSGSHIKSSRHDDNTLKRVESGSINNDVDHHNKSSVMKDEKSNEVLDAKPKEDTIDSGNKDVEMLTSTSCDKPTKSERESLVERWRLNNCKSLEEMADKLDILSKMEADEIIELEKQTWTRSAPADLYYKRHSHNYGLMEASPKLLELCDQFESELLHRADQMQDSSSACNGPHRRGKLRLCKHEKSAETSSNSSCEESSSDDEEDKAMMELERKRKHPQRLHPELWHNEPGEMNDGPLCRCSQRARRSGIRHNVYVGEQQLKKCDVNTNNAGKLYHYRVTMSPPVNFLTKTPTIIEHDSHEYIFEGFSMFSHFPLVKLPTCKVIRFNIEYTILYVDESMPENFTIRELDLFYKFLFHEVLELLDLDLRAFGDPSGCNQFHFMPRFVRDLPENGKEILSMNEVLKYLIKSNRPLIPEDRLNEIYNMSLYDWQTFADEVKCMVVTNPGMKPCSLRVDQLDRDTMDEGRYPEIVHFGIRPPQLSYAGNPEYQRAWREYVKFRHLLANMPKPSAEDKRKLMGKENRLQEMRTLSKMKRDVTIALSSKGFHRTGIMCDIIQHAMLLPVLVCHLRFHRSLDQLENDMDYKFQNRYLLQLALTHPSYRENFGTNPDHARNSLTNCGIRQPEYGDRRIHYMNTRKRGINTLIQIMSRFGKKEATESNIGHNERLEFLGDAVVEFITSIHLFHLFPDLEEGGLATYRAAIVQNQHLAVMAQRLNLDSYMLYAHGSDLCHDLELRHAMANCFEALMGALFLDGGIEIADKVFGHTLWKQESKLVDVWMNYPLHPLQEQEPSGDRQWILHFPVLQKLTEFEERSGIEFKHIRLLARAFTDRSVGYTNLTLGSNQRLEFLGDTVLQIIASEYLYKFFPEHHEGHLSLLRSSLVNNRTQAVVCDDLGMTSYAIYANPKHDIKTKDRADLLEAFLGALYIDKGLKHCHVFCEVCFFPRLQDFIMNQDWNDPKSKLQQCCLTLRTMEGGEPDIPVYKVIECMGPTNTRVYTVAVYFRGQRLAQASGHSIQQAEMNAANQALSMSTELFPQLDHQRRVIAKSMKKQKKRAKREAALKAAREVRDLELKEAESRNRSRREDRRMVSGNRDYERHRDRHSDRRRSAERDRDSKRLRARDAIKDYVGTSDRRDQDKSGMKKKDLGDRDHKVKNSREKSSRVPQNEHKIMEPPHNGPNRQLDRSTSDVSYLPATIQEEVLKVEKQSREPSEAQSSGGGSPPIIAWAPIRSRSDSFSSDSSKTQPVQDSNQFCRREGFGVWYTTEKDDCVPGPSGMGRDTLDCSIVLIENSNCESEKGSLQNRSSVRDISQKDCSSDDDDSENEMPNSTNYIWDRLRDCQTALSESSSCDSDASDETCPDPVMEKRLEIEEEIDN